MSKAAGFIFSPEYGQYNFNPDHPFNMKRLDLTLEMLQATGLLQARDIITAPEATTEELLFAHDREYIEVVKQMSTGGQVSPERGIGSEDTPAFPDMHRASALVVGGSLRGARAVMEGEVDHAVNLAGGLHHAMREKASGFCIYNDAVAAIKFIRQQYNVRVAYVDIDAHHGDGVQAAFYDDPNVLTISLHETGRYLFPGTGHIHERGVAAGFGYCANIPLEAFTEDGSWIKAFEAVVPYMLGWFQPDIIVSQNGCDSHYLDPLTHLCCTTKAYSIAFHQLHLLAHRLCKGRLLALGGGGYEWWRVVPRVWSTLWAELSERKLPGEIPTTLLERWQKESGENLPLNFEDPQGCFPPIPRRGEIEEKNLLTVRNVLDSATYQFTKYL
jgi:acetoin utilization protein AcuC